MDKLAYLSHKYNMKEVMKMTIGPFNNCISLRFVLPIMGAAETRAFSFFSGASIAMYQEIMNEGTMSVGAEIKYLQSKINECLQDIKGDIYLSDVITIAVSLGIEKDIVLNYILSLGLEIKK